MPRYLIELTHEDEHIACIKALRAIDQYGSHFVTHADWGCKDGTHSGWLIADLESREAAMRMVPPEFRDHAHIVLLNRFDRKEITSMIAELEG